MRRKDAMSDSLMIKDRTGSKATASTTMEHVTIPVTGMTCAACQSYVQRELANQDGVQDATFNLMLHNAAVTCDPDATSISALVEAIRGSGYGAELPHEDMSVLEEQEEHDEE